MPVTVGGEWYWDGSAWRRTVENPWSPRQRHPVRAGNRVAPALTAPVVFLAALGAQIVGRALTALIRIVVGVFAFGAVVALVVLLIAAMLRA